MTLRPLHDPASGPLKVVGFMSGSGTNLCQLLEHERKLEEAQGSSPYKIVGIFSDSWKSQATKIGGRFDIPVVTSNIRGYYRSRGQPRHDMAVREGFDRLAVELLRPLHAKVAVYAGYMSISTKQLFNAYLGINVHPGDLSIECEGRRRFVGAHAVRDAIMAGERTVSSTTHLVEEVVDGGRLLLLSAPMTFTLPDDFDPHDEEQLLMAESRNLDRLKEKGDWVIFPLTLQYLAEGRFAIDDHGTVHFDEKPIPRGLRLPNTG